MAYQLYRTNPYEKKICFFKDCLVTGTVLLASGVFMLGGARIVKQHVIEQTEETYAQTISYYDEMIEKTAQFFKENGVISPEDCFELYTKLLWNGYFSQNGSYTYNVNEKFDIDGYFGIMIVSGSAVCRGNEDFFCKLMNKLGYHAYQMACTMQTGDEKISKKDLIIGNHMITVVETKDLTYYFDTTNGCTYEAIDICKGKNVENDIAVLLNPIASYVYGDNDLEEATQSFQSKTTTPSYVVQKKLNRNEQSKVYELRKNLEPTISNICDSIKNEG